jgi:hypothetical protein
MKLSLAEISNMVPLPDFEAPLPRIIYVSLFGPMEKHCAWCDEENGVKHLGNVTHGICTPHLCSNLMHSVGKDSLETLFQAVICQLGSQEAGR